MSIHGPAVASSWNLRTISQGNRLKKYSTHVIFQMRDPKNIGAGQYPIGKGFNVSILPKNGVSFMGLKLFTEKDLEAQLELI